MILFGLFSTLFNRGHQRNFIFLGGLVFMTGLILFVVNQYEILETTSLFLPSFFVVLGSGSLMLYIDNTKEKLFLVTALVLLFLGYITAISFKENALVIFANEVGITILTYWPFLFLVIGIYYLLKVRNKKSSF